MPVDSDIHDLASSIKQTLDASGGLSAIRAQLRAQVFGAMAISMPQLEQKPTLNPAAKVALGLIEEFLRFHNCSCTLSTAESEVAGWSERLPHGELTTATGLAKSDAPLLVQLVNAQLPGIRAQLNERRPATQAPAALPPHRPPPLAPVPATSPVAASPTSPGGRPAALSPSGIVAASHVINSLAPLKSTSGGGREAEEEFMQATSPPASPTSPGGRPAALSPFVIVAASHVIGSLAPLKGASGGRGAEEEFV